METQLQAWEREHLETLEKRRDFLADRVHNHAIPNQASYDRRERAALAWAIEAIRRSPEAARKIRR